MARRDPVLREMTLHGVPAVLDVQEPAAVAGLSGVFPQDVHPFPRDGIGQRWRTEIADQETDCLVILRNGTIAGLRRSEPTRCCTSALLTYLKRIDRNPA